MQKTTIQERIKVLRNTELFLWVGVIVFFILTVLCYIAWIWDVDGRWAVTAMSLCVVCAVLATSIDHRATQLERLVRKNQKPDNHFDS